MIYSNLREAIVTGELKVGEKIVLSKVASDLGVSTIPVREAVKQLMTEGLIDLVAHTEAVVSRLSEKDFNELIEIRVLLESYATRLATERSTAMFTEILEEKMKAMADSIALNNVTLYNVLNREFHDTIHTYCGNEQLVKMIELIILRTDRAQLMFQINQSRIKDSYAEHRKILDAIKGRQSKLASEIVASHTRQVLELFLQYYLAQLDDTSSGNS
jgi:DNA-binding GntR family transcriptional regulator